MPIVCQKVMSALRDFKSVSVEEDTVLEELLAALDELLAALEEVDAEEVAVLEEAAVLEEVAALEEAGVEETTALEVTEPQLVTNVRPANAKIRFETCFL